MTTDRQERRLGCTAGQGPSAVEEVQSPAVTMQQCRLDRQVTKYDTDH